MMAAIHIIMLLFALIAIVGAFGLILVLMCDVFTENPKSKITDWLLHKGLKYWLLAMTTVATILIIISGINLILLYA